MKYKIHNFKNMDYDTKEIIFSVLININIQSNAEFNRQIKKSNNKHNMKKITIKGGVANYSFIQNHRVFLFAQIA